MSRKIVSVVGATGSQGGSVVKALLKEGIYTVRGITRNPNGAAAKALAAQGVEVIKADVNDLASLTAAFNGSSAIYAITDFFEPFGKHGPAKAMEIEVKQGTNLAKAASSVSTLEHYIWSTLPNGRKVSGGKFLVPHFESKNKIDDYIRSDASLLAKTTFLWITFYGNNYDFPMFTPIEVPTAGKYIQVQNTPPSTAVKTIGDVSTNVGLFVKAILAQPKLTLPGKFVLAHVEDTTIGDMLQTWAKVQGKVAQYVQVDNATFNAIWPLWAEEMGIMMEFWYEAGEDSWSGEETILTKDDLGIEGLVGLEKSLVALKY